MKSFARIISAVTIGYLILLFALFRYSESVADPTKGGISRSEVLEGIFPGGLSGLLVVLIVLILATGIAWISAYGRRFNT